MDTFFRKNALIGLAEIVCRVPLIFTVGYLAWSVGAETFGNWSLILAFQVCVVGVFGFGLSASLSRFLPASQPGEAAAYLRYAFLLCLGSLFAAFALTALLRAPIAKLLGVRTELDWLLPMAVLMAAGSIADGLLDAFFKGRMAVGRQVGFVAARTAAEVIAVVLVFVLAPSVFGEAPSRLAAYVGVVVAGKLAIYPWLLVGMGGEGVRLPPDRRRMLLRYGLPMVPTLLAVWLVSQGDRLVLSLFVTKADLGIYAFGASLAAYTVFLGYAVYPLLLPAASKLHDGGDAAGVAELFRSSQQLYLLLWAAAMAGLALWSSDIIAWTGGSAYAGAAPVLLILCFAVGVDQLMGVYQYVFHLVKRTDLILWLNVFNAAITIGSLAIAGWLSGLALAPWAVLGATVFFNVLRYRVALRYVFLPMPAVYVIQAGVVAVLTATLARYGADWNVVMRLLLCAGLMTSIGAYIVRGNARLRKKALAVGSLG